MITNLRVGIPIIGGEGWLGGVSHMELHVKAVTSLPRNERPQLFLIINDENIHNFCWYRSFISLFDGVIFMGANIAEARSAIGMIFIHCLSMDELFTKIDFYFPVSFNVLPGRCAASWIHDFQHRYLPEFFSHHDIELRDALCQRIAEHSRLVFCSSHAVAKDFWKFYPSSKAATKVLALRISPEEEWYAGNPIEIQKKYGIPDRFVLCSNQFWTHKNHRLLFEAISFLRQLGQEVHLVCTGSTNDFRCPDYFNELQQFIKDLGIDDLIHIIGLIPRQDQIQLLRRSLFVVQPSLFEGLSLIVEECRALGKDMILSDLDVHLEHEYGIYFNRLDSMDLAKKMTDLLAGVQPGPEVIRENEAKAQAVGLTRIYAKEFCDLVEESQKLVVESQKKANRIHREDIIVATSLNLRGDLSHQQRAVSSWIELGFKPISINAFDEIVKLKPIFPEIEFFAVNRDARGKYDKPFIYLEDIFKYLDQQECRVCGIVQADICLFRHNFHSFIVKEAVNSLIYGPKFDVAGLDVCPEQDFPSLGYVFFDRQIIPHYPQAEFCMGLPWWDYWMVLMSMMRKIPVKKLSTPLAYHVVHPEQYSIEQSVILGNIMANYAPPSFPLSIKTISRYHQIVVQLIEKLSSSILWE